MLKVILILISLLPMMPAFALWCCCAAAKRADEQFALAWYKDEKDGEGE